MSTTKTSIASAVAIGVSAVSFAITAVTHASQFPFHSIFPYALAILAVVVGFGAGVIIGRRKVVLVLR